jgi:Fe-S cluster assembly protein SufB
MSTNSTESDQTNKVVKDVAAQDYKYGFVTDIEAESLPPGLNEDTVRWISAKKE